jgi:hypothetical protein
MPDPLKRHLPVSLQTTPARLVFLALAASVAASLLSIAASEILLFFAAVGAVALLKPQPGRL